MSIAEIVVAAGLVSLALGAVSGFALLAAVDKPELLKRVGVVDLVRVRQVHLDWIIMGVVMIAVGLAVPNMPLWAGVLTLFGGVVNPATFLPMAFSRTVASTRTFQTVSFISFCSLSVGLIANSLVYISRFVS